jgi:dimeric dUTPase (all-alpha-NTP-PPase superfamily)
MSQYECFKCKEPIRFDKDWKDDEGKSIPLEIDEDVPHKHNRKAAKQITATTAGLIDKGLPLSQGDKLDQIFDMQEKLDIRIIENMERPPPAELDKWIAMFATAIMHEAAELQDLTNWKWWKRSREFDKDSAIEEIIDIWHFVVAASIEVGLRPHDILREYERKNKINHQRQSEGY